MENAEYWGNLYAALAPPGENPVEPASDMNYPVYTNLSRIHYEEAGGYDASEIVGIVTSTFYWRDLFKNILPGGRKGIDVVVDNPCKASFTYRIKYVPIILPKQRLLKLDTTHSSITHYYVSFLFYFSQWRESDIPWSW